MDDLEGSPDQAVTPSPNVSPQRTPLSLTPRSSGRRSVTPGTPGSRSSQRSLRSSSRKRSGSVMSPGLSGSVRKPLRTITPQNRTRHSSGDSGKERTPITKPTPNVTPFANRSMRQNHSGRDSQRPDALDENNQSTVYQSPRSMQDLLPTLNGREALRNLNKTTASPVISGKGNKSGRLYINICYCIC